MILLTKNILKWETDNDGCNLDFLHVLNLKLFYAVYSKEIIQTIQLVSERFPWNLGVLKNKIKNNII